MKMRTITMQIENLRKPVEPIHPELSDALQEILGDTFGLIVYQDK